jgi:CMD domain protein
MTAPTTTVDVIDRLAGIDPDSRTAALRREKPDLVRFAQGSYDALLEPAAPEGVSLVERHAIAYRAALLTRFPEVAEWHRSRLEELGATPETIQAIAELTDGHYAAGNGIGPRLQALLAHTSRVTVSPGSAQPEHIAQLKAAGLTPKEIVTVGQLVAFVSYQVRAIAVARALEESHA